MSITTNQPKFTASNPTHPANQRRGNLSVTISVLLARLNEWMEEPVIVWLAADPETEPRVYTTPTGERRIVFNSSYGLPLKCVSCNAPALFGLPRCFECHGENLRKIREKFLPAVLAILAVVVPFALCVLHAKGLVKW